MNQPELDAQHTTSLSTFDNLKASLRILIVAGKIRILFPSLCPVKVERERGSAGESGEQHGTRGGV